MSAIVSSILDNIPFVITMIPVIKELIAKLAISQEITNTAIIQVKIAYPLWWALALGACLGGNGTLIGASANILVSKIGERNKAPISFIQFSKYGFPFMLQSIIIALIYLWIRFLR
jgi:Na+/H+ antiporter NhaD/arsenite permease-like protein